MRTDTIAIRPKSLDAPACRLCGSATALKFTERVLRKHDVRYWYCADCGSLQTDAPYWLDEAYATVDPATDTGMVARSIQMAQITSLMLRATKVDQSVRCVDWGGGNGLFCRMMRDQGYNFFNYDKYAKPFYCIGFSTDLPSAESGFEIVTSFEVFEHLPDPHIDLASIVGLKPALWIFSTQLYRDQGPDWDYLSRDNGRHVFFYSDRGLREFGARHGLTFISGGGVHAFVRTGSKYEAMIRRILGGKKFATLAAMIQFDLRQRRAYLRWMKDRDLLMQAGILPGP